MLITPLGLPLYDGTVVRRESFRVSRDETGQEYLTYECNCTKDPLPQEAWDLSQKTQVIGGIQVDVAKVPADNIDETSPIYWYYLKYDPYQTVRGLLFVTFSARIVIERSSELRAAIRSGNIPVLQHGDTPKEL
jgi:hypothetical protein